MVSFRNFSVIEKWTFFDYAKDMQIEFRAQCIFMEPPSNQLDPKSYLQEVVSYLKLRTAIPGIELNVDQKRQHQFYKQFPVVQQQDLL